MADLTVELAGAKLRNPTVLASGIIGTTAGLLKRVADAGAGAVTIKSIGPVPRKGNPGPVFIEVEGGALNAVGLPNPGVDNALEELAEAVKECKSPVIASFFAGTTKGFGEVAEKLAHAKPALLEADCSCPNTDRDLGTPFAYDPEAIAMIVEEVKERTKIPLFVKVAPDTHRVVEVAKAAEKAGADGITAVNTARGMAIDIEARKPVLGNKTGGLSGPALRPIAVRCVYDIYEAVEIPIIGTGGVGSGRDAVEMMMAGATAVGIGTAVMHRGIGVFAEVAKEMEEWMDAHGVKRASELTGLAHE